MFYWGWASGILSTTRGLNRNSAVHNGRNNVFVLPSYVIYGCCRYNSSVEGPLLLQHSACVPLNCLCPSESCSYETRFSGDYDHLRNENVLFLGSVWTGVGFLHFEFTDQMYTSTEVCTNMLSLLFIYI